MRNVLAIALALAPLIGNASEASLKAIGLETTDESGCFTTNGTFVSPTISLMVAAYDDPKIKNHVAISIIEVAIKSGCDIEAPDSMGLSPLNAAILFNKPKLVSLLLSNGASPNKPISSPKDYLNGLNSYQLLEFLSSKGKNLGEIKKLLAEHKSNA
jgi:ankyrin repeat protein